MNARESSAISTHTPASGESAFISFPNKMNYIFDRNKHTKTFAKTQHIKYTDADNKTLSTYIENEGKMHQKSNTADAIASNYLFVVRK